MTESGLSWEGLFEDEKTSGFHQSLMISDGAHGLWTARTEVFRRDINR